MSADWPSLPAHLRTGRTRLDEEDAARRVLAGALRWIEAHLEWFAPRRWEEFLPRRPFRPGPLLELLGLVRVLDRSALLPRDAPVPSRALTLAEEAVRDADFARGLHRGDAFFPYHLNLTALLELLGRPHPALRAACEELLAADAGGHCRPYKPVLSRTELRYFIDRGGFTAPAALPGLGALYRESIAARSPDVLQLTGSETYALTHVLFYVTDFGHHRRLPDRSGAAAEVRETVRVLLGVHLARGGLDLLAELLLCDSALDDGWDDGWSDGQGDGCGHGHGSGPLRHAGWNALAAAQREDGAVPSPLHRPEVLAGLTGDKAAAYLFGTCYHTTLAAALAAAVRKPGTPATGSTQSIGGPLPRADPEEIRQWARKAAERAGTAPAAVRNAWAAHLDPLLALGVQAHDPGVLADVLRAAERLGRGDRPLVRSAAALLAAWEPGGRGARPEATRAWSV
ncbi:DUF6895 family protein [Streptomyces sp. NPDC098085]|uniref:DUF6895 family protein n=1 Tax=Streptomyces sp. NPDC098085 TaxID=3366094 RepID=UPI00381B67C9